MTFLEFLKLLENVKNGVCRRRDLVLAFLFTLGDGCKTVDFWGVDLACKDCEEADSLVDDLQSVELGERLGQKPS